MPDTPATAPRRVAATGARAWLKLRHQVLGRRYRRLVLEHVDGVPLVVLPDVFNPVLLRSGAILARAVARMPLENLRVLDLGTGSGIGAIFAARRGASVTAVDINPEAVRCAGINALLNQLEDRIDCRDGDLFEPVRGERFDLILFNPPYYRGTPRDALDHAWRGEGVFERFSAQLAGMLEPGGRALLVLSTDGDCAALLAQLERDGFRDQVVERKDLINEVVTIHEVRPAAAG
jgi:release factor glutamine methyltransferase